MVFRIFASVVFLMSALGGSRAVAYSLLGSKWTSATTTMQLQLGATNATLSDGFASWDASAEDALATWNANMGALKFVVVRDSTAVKAQGNRSNNVFFSSNIYGTAWGSGVLAVTLTFKGGTSTTETDVLFNSGLSWNSYRGAQRSSGGTAVFDLHRVAMHEFGHVLGLDHPDDHGQTVSAIMNSHISSIDTLTSDDIAGAQSLYGAPGSSAISVPVITSQPANLGVTAGQSASFSVTATSTVAVTYQWAKNGSPIGGATNAAYTIAATSTGDAGTYAVTVTNSAGSVTSNGATLTVNSASTTTTTPPATTVTPTASAPAITNQPANQTAALGGTATFSITASGTGPLSYQWRKNGFSLGGAFSATLTLSNVQASDAGSYSVLVSNTAGSVASSAATLTVQTAPVITTQPADQVAMAGQQIVFTVAASGTNLTYQWRKDGADIAGATVASYTIASVQSAQAGTYSVVVSNSGGATISASARLTVTSPPVFTNQPASQSIAAGSSVTFSATTDSTTGVSYQWYHDDQAISGATTASFTLGSTQPADAGTYRVVATNSVGAVSSTSATLTVVALPRITTAVASQTVTAGDRLTLSVAATGSPAPTYQWQKDGVDIAGATGANLTVAATSPTDAGAYTVRITNAAGSITSSAAAVTVKYSRLINLSTRGFVPAGGALTPGFFIRGDKPKPLVIRAVGPTLSLFGVGTALSAASLDVLAPDAHVIASNTNWGNATALDNAFSQVGAFPLAANSKDAAVQSSFTPQAYTVRVSPTEPGLSGVTLAEIYDADSTPTATRLVNVSTLGFVGPGENQLTAGFVISGNTTKRLLIRAIGPGLAPFGVGDILADPKLSLLPLGGTDPIATNDDWPDLVSVRSAFTAAGAFNLTAGSKDAALVISLEPGGYTVIVSGAGTSTGNALVEIYDLDP